MDHDDYPGRGLLIPCMLVTLVAGIVWTVLAWPRLGSLALFLATLVCSATLVGLGLFAKWCWDRREAAEAHGEPI